MRPTVMFSSRPLSALVAGLKIGGSSGRFPQAGRRFSPANVPSLAIFAPGRA
jgi:hypothetical protein